MVRGPEASRLCLGRRGFFESARFDSEIRVQIDLSGLNRFVPEPECDHGAVVAGLEELDGGSVAQDVRGYVLVDESRALVASGSGMLFDEPLDSVAAEGAAATAGEQRLRWSITSLLEPVPENRDRLRG